MEGLRMGWNYFETVNVMFTWLISIAAFVVWIIFAAAYGDSDSVPVYTLDREVPKLGRTFESTSTNTPATQSLQAAVNLLDWCVMPSVYQRFSGQQFPNWALDGIQPQKTAVTQWENYYFDSWARHTLPGTGTVLNSMNIPYDDTDLPPQHFNPMCRCIHAVLTKYTQLNDPTKISGAQDAIRSCIATRQHIPRQALVFDSNLEIRMTKSLSRSGLLLLMMLALVFNVLMRGAEANKDSGGVDRSFLQKYWREMVAVVIFIFMVALPTANSGVDSNNTAQFYSVIFFPGFVLLFSVELCWYLVDSLNFSVTDPSHEINTKRYMYMHPFTFFVTLTALYTLALLENGVFTLENLFTYYWSSLGISTIYTVILFCTHKDICKDNARCRTGYLLFVFLAGMVVTLHLVPDFPTKPTLNFLWILPACFAGFNFGGIVVVERFLKGEKGDSSGAQAGDMDVFTETAHLLQLGHSAVLIIVLIYFTSILFSLSMGGPLLFSANAQMDRLNFEIAENLPANGLYGYQDLGRAIGGTYAGF